MKSENRSAAVFSKTLLLVSVYFLMGMAGLQLAIAPGYASAVFPAAGIALAALLCDKRLIPGVWLGSFGINLWVASSHGLLRSDSLLIAAGIGLGAVIQAWAGASLIRYKLKDAWRRLDNERDIIKFLLLGGPISCLISATWGNVVLLQFHVFTSSELAFSWWNWWVGDTIGVMLFTPLALMVSRCSGSLWASRLKHVAIPSLIVTAGVIASFVYVANTESHHLKQRIAEQGKSLSAELKSDLLSYEEIVSSLDNLVQTNPDINSADFATFVKHDFESHSELQALSWNPIVSEAAREKVESVMGKELHVGNFKFSQRDASGRLIPAEHRVDYVIVRYIAPLDENRNALGYDIASGAVRAAAIQTAIQTGKPAATAPIRLVQEQASSAGVLLLHPVYLNMPASGSHNVSGATYGFAVGVLRVQDILSRISGQRFPKDLDLILEDKGAPSGNQLLYRTGRVPESRFSMFTWGEDIPFNGRIWHISVYPTPEYMAANRSLFSWMVLAIGLILASFLQAILLAMTGRTSIIQRQVFVQTETLRRESEKNQALLRNASDGIHILDFDGNIIEASDSFCAMLGYARNEIIGMNVAQWDVGFKDDTAKLTLVRQQFKNSNRSQFETRHRRKDGSVFDVEVSGMALELDGRPALFNSARDITDRKLMETRALKEQDFIGAVINSAGALVVVINSEGFVTHFNRLAEEITGYLFEEIKDIPFIWERFLLPEQSQGVCSVFREIKSGKITPYYENYWVNKNGEQRLIAWANTLLFDDENQMEYVIAVGNDISERKLAEDELRIAATAFESQEGIIITDAAGVILRVNLSFTKITGYLSEEIVGENPRMLSSGRHDKSFYAAMWDVINRTGAWNGEIWNRRKSGEVYPEHLTITAVKNSNGIVTHYVSTLIDITVSKAAEDEIKHLAFYDPLTKLPNRRLLQDRLRQALISVVRSSRTVALLFIDLDNFKMLNDTLGHDIGDILLKQVAIRLESCVREGDTVARLGGDEFVVMLEGLNKNLIDAAEQTKLVGNKILETLNQVYQLATHECHNTPSIGVTLFNDNSQPIDELLKQADIAMYQSKKSGRNNLHFFDPVMQHSINVRVTLERELHQALEHQQFVLYYQIQIGGLQEDGTHRPLGAEALIRWHHPERGLVSPAEFIHLAEESGLIQSLGLWVLDTACAQLARWQHNLHTRDLTLSVNVSAKQFRERDFVDQVQSALQKHSINPSLLKLELTESLLLKDIEETIMTMDSLNALGIKLSLDDFGTGYSSLQYLKRLPFYQLKIDLSFVRDIVIDSGDKAIVQTIIVIAKSLNMNVISEGVETEKQLRLLLDMGCTHYQGYLFGYPVPIEQFEDLLKQG